MEKLINNEIRPRRDEFGNIYCECCGDQFLSDDPKIAAEGLCDRCNREINEDS